MILTRALQNSFRPVLRPTFPACNSLKCSSITPSLFSTKVSPSSGDKAKKSSSVSAAKKVPAVVKTKKATAAAAAAVVKEDSPGKKKAAVAAKPPPPKRALSAYSLFLRNEYNKVKEQSPNLKFVEISKKLSDLWKELPNDQKSRYLREAEKAHAVAKSKEGPKPPPNAYAVFAKEVYKIVQNEHPDLAFAQLSRKVAERWQKLPDLEKAARKDRYRQKLDQYKKMSASASASAS